MIDCEHFLTNYFKFAVPVNITTFRYPPGHIRVGDSLKIFCNISIDTAASPGVNNNDINITLNWRKADQPTSDQAITLQTSSGHGVFRYSSVLSINSLTLADSERYTCIATILPHFGSFNETKQVSTIDIQLSKYTLSLSILCMVGL